MKIQNGLDLLQSSQKILTNDAGQSLTNNPFTNGLLSPSQLLAASQTAALMAAARGLPLAFNTTDAMNLFQQSLLSSIWSPNQHIKQENEEQTTLSLSPPPSSSPSSPLTTGVELSANDTLTNNNNNNNNNIVSSSSELNRRKYTKRKNIPRKDDKTEACDDKRGKLRVKNIAKEFADFHAPTFSESSAIKPESPISNPTSGSSSPNLESSYNSSYDTLQGFASRYLTNLQSNYFKADEPSTPKPNTTKVDCDRLDVSTPNSQLSTSPAPEQEPSQEPRKFTCNTCNRSFGYKHVLQNHMRTHTGEKPFECPECHKRFTRDHHLRTHIRLHTGERPYHCDHCGKYFVQVANLRRHLRVHTGERPYSCKDCGSTFSDSNQLKSHLLIHKGEKPFDCERCGSKFRRKHHFAQHKCAGADVTTLSTSSISSPEIEPENTSDSLTTPVTGLIRSTGFYGALLQQHKRQMELLGESHVQDLRKEKSGTSYPLDLSKVPEQTEPEDLSVRSNNNNRNVNKNYYADGFGQEIRSKS